MTINRSGAARCLRAGILALAVSASLGGCGMFENAESRVNKAERLMAQHDYRGAMIELKNAIESEPQHARARLKLAEVSVALGDPATAEKELRRAFEAGATPEEAARVAADVRLALGQVRELLAQIDSGELPLEEPYKSEYRGRALLALRDFPAAMEAFRAALQAAPDRLEPRLGVAEVQAASGNSDAALSELESITAAHPNAPAAWLARGTLLMQRGQFEAAREALETAKKNAADLVPTQQTMLLSVMTETQLALGDVDAARRSHQQLEQLAPGSALTGLLKAKIAMATQNYSAAVSELQPLVNKVPGFVPGRFLLGAALLAQGNLNQAEQHLARVVHQAPDNIEARKLLAQVRLRLDRPNEAMQVLMPAVGLEQSDTQVDALMSAAYMQQGQTQQALSHLERSVAQNPTDRNLKLELASAYLRNGQERRALELLNGVARQPGDARREALIVTALTVSEGIPAARTQVNKWVKESPDDPALLNFAASFIARQGEIDAARALLAKAAAATPNDTATLLNWARIESTQGNFAEAADRLNKALAIDPQNASAQLGLAQLAIKRGDFKDAIQRLEELRKRDAKAITPRMELARVYLQQNELTKAQELIRETIAAAPGRADVRSGIGMLYLDANRYEEALAEFREATTLDSRDARHWMNMARAQLALGNRGVARESLQRALTERPDWVPAISALVLLDLQEKKNDAALQRVAELRKSRPKDPAGMTLEGDVYAALGQHAKADAAYSAAAVQGPTQELAVKSYRARHLGKLPDAAKPLEQWLVRSPDDIGARLLLAEAYGVAGQRRKAIEQYELAVAQRPDDVTALNNLAWFYYEAGDARAEQTARRAYEKARSSAAVADTYGWILVQTGKPAEGLSVLQEAVRAEGGEDPEIQYHLAVALARTGDRAAAQARLSQLLNRDGDFASRADARKLLEQLKAGAAGGL
jgi:putative PEP-CTERM system TPR-repeat lipoprotein